MAGLQLKDYIIENKLTVKIQPNSSKNEVYEIKDKILKIRINAPPEDGKANAELLKFLKKEYKLDARILKGHKGREKILLIQNP